MFKKEYVKFVNPSGPALDNEFGASWGNHAATADTMTPSDDTGAFVPPPAHMGDVF